jgi:hypothetical protein
MKQKELGLDPSNPRNPWFGSGGVSMGEPVRVVSCPDPDYPSGQHDHLWLLVGGEDYFHGSRAYYLGPDRDIEGDDIASRQIAEIIETAKSNGLSVERQDADEALANYRRSRGYAS